MSDKYVFVLGGTKSATSSIYRYLGDHPEITPSLQKQADFFLENRYENIFVKTDSVSSVDIEFDKYFPSRIGVDGSILLDVSPDYFCSETALHGLARFLTNKRYRLYIIVRDPVDRLVSWYQFGQQIGLVPENMNFEAFVDSQDDDSENAAFSALCTGRFTHYLDLWLERFPADKVDIVRFDSLSSNPSETMITVATTLGVSPDFYKEYQFHNHNKTQKVKSRWVQTLYVQSQRSIRGWISGNEFLSRILAPVFFQASKIYRKLNAESTKKFEIDDAMKKYLENYYEAELRYLDGSK